ncbi:zinc-dependent alcohol dehydrogenase family protein [Mycolicibacterium peregrinum]|nr:NAD(P)-dependent alcohol dehydrogenase [Mycolicibacterium peregrinum]
MAEIMRRWEMGGIGRDALQLREVDVPQPGPDEILIKVAAVSLNHRDKMVIETGRGLPLKFPFAPGSDLAGTVVAAGDAVTRFAVDDQVISVFTPDWLDGARAGDARTPSYWTLGGFYPGVLAEYVALPQDWVVRAPRTLSPAEASTLPVAGLTAWFALVERGHVRAGDVVLVEGTGGVALFGVQTAKMHGAEVIVSGSADKLDRVLELGADHVVDRRSADWAESILALTGDRGVDHVLELLGGRHLGKAAQVVAVGGHIHLIGALDGFEASTPVMPILMKDITIHGIGTGHRRALSDLVSAIDSTETKPVIGARYPFHELSAALDHLDRGPFGKIVVEVG